MGKITGFLEFERQDETYQAPKERIKNYKEFTIPLETSKYFSNRLLKLLPKIIKSLNQDTIEEYFISKKGYLNYRYLNLLNYLIDG